MGNQHIDVGQITDMECLRYMVNDLAYWQALMTKPKDGTVSGVDTASKLYIDRAYEHWTKRNAGGSGHERIGH